MTRYRIQNFLFSLFVNTELIPVPWIRIRFFLLLFRSDSVEILESARIKKHAVLFFFSFFTILSFQKIGFTLQINQSIFASQIKKGGY